MARKLTDFTGQDVREGAVIVYSTRQANSVRMSEGVVRQVASYRDPKGRTHKTLTVQPTGRDSGDIQRKTRNVVEIAAEHFAVVGYQSPTA
ncbi:hypothetical protein ACFVHB_20135 [Kitasatospora sp. NPDC127111]|uniref:hypothetical protein n=1 Tax=Kitasatospora sp. NPDC127111 TaxID=3345363 RepID=UPI00363ADA70